MFTYLKEVFNLTNRYVVLATPLILFSLISTIYLAVSMHGSIVKCLLILLLFVLMIAVFFAGWGNMLKNAVILQEKDNNTNSLIKHFSSGIGEYFLPVLFSLINFFVLTLLIFAISQFAGMFFIGNPNIQSELLTGALKTPETFSNFLTSLGATQIKQLTLWYTLWFLTICLDYFLFIFYYPAIFFKTKNPFLAFYSNLKVIFSKKFLQILSIFVFALIAYFVLSSMSILCGKNIILNLILTIINFYYFVFLAVGIFYYYYKNFIQISDKQNLTENI